MTDSIIMFRFYDRIKFYFFHILFLFFLLLGLFVFPDFGISFDEPVNRDNGGVTYNYVSSVLGVQNDVAQREDGRFDIRLREYRDRDYGVIFDLPAFALERALKIEDPRDQYLLRHLLTFFTYWLGGIALFCVLKQNFTSSLIPSYGVLIYFLTPRIFADSFYNSKDIFLLSLCSIGTFTFFIFLRRRTIFSGLIHALITAFIIDTRINGLVVFGATLFVYLGSLQTTSLEKKQSLTSIFFYITATIIFIIAFWPWLWESPISNFLIAFSNMANFRWPNYNFYYGEYVLATNLPWHYSGIWILFTVPVLYTALALGGIYSVSKGTFFSIRSRQLQFNGILIIGLFSMTVLFGTLVAVVVFKSTLYDGWRQLYFLYPYIVILSALGLDFLLRSLIIFKLYFLKYIVYFLIFLQVLTITIWMKSAHPYQNLYFNFLAPSDWSNYFEGDYWGLTNFQLLKNIAERDSRGTIHVSGVGAHSIRQSINFLPKTIANRFIFVNSDADADYLISNFRFFSKNDFRAIGADWTLFDEITLGKNTVAVSYSRRPKLD